MYILVHLRCCYFLSCVFVSCHVFGSSRHMFPFCIRYFTFRSRVVLVCHVFPFLRSSLCFVIGSSSIFVSPHFSRAHSTHLFHLNILCIFYFTRESSRRVLEYGSKKHIAKNRLSYVLAVSQGPFGLQRS